MIFVQSKNLIKRQGENKTGETSRLNNNQASNQTYLYSYGHHITVADAVQFRSYAFIYFHRYDISLIKKNKIWFYAMEKLFSQICL